MAYIDGFVAPAPSHRKEDYRAMSIAAAAIFREYGALQIVETWGDDVPDGKVTDFKRAVAAEAGDSVIFSWIVWPSKAVRDEGQRRMREDPRMQDMSDMPFDPKRMIYGGFEVLLDTLAEPGA